MRNLSADSTLVLETPATIFSDNVPDAVSADLKVIDPAVYPYYGRIQTGSGRPLRGVLDGNSAIVSPDLLESLGVRLGDPIHINGAEFSIADVITSEPDRYATPPPVAGRIILGSEAFEQIDRPGGAAARLYRVHLRIGPGGGLRALCARLEEILPQAQVLDYTSRTLQSATVEWVIPFLNLLGVLFMALGGVGIGAAAYFHLLRNQDTIAALKCLGARARTISGVYLLQTLELALVGASAGVCGGKLVEMLFNGLASRLVRIKIEGGGGALLAAEVIGLGVIAAALAAWAPLSQVRSIPALAFQRKASGVADVIRLRKPRRAGRVLRWVTGERRQIPQLVLRKKGKPLRAPLVRRLTWALREGLTNVRRYRSRWRAASLTLAGGIAVIVIAVVGERRLGAYLIEALPFRQPSLLVVNLDASSRTELSRALAPLPGAEPPQWVRGGLVALSRAGDATLESLRAAHRQTWIQKDWPASCSDSAPPLVEVESGRWWPEDPAEPAVALNRDLARLWGVTTGSRLDLLAGDRPIRARVYAVLRIPLAQQIWWSEIILDCRSLPGALYSGAIRIAPERLAQVRSWLRERFPDLLFIDIDDLIKREERTSSNGLRVLRLVGVFACLLASFLLAAILAAQRTFRVAQIAILRALGASKRDVLVSLAVEYMVRGGIAGFFGGVLGCAGTSLILHSAAGITEWSPGLPVICVATLGAAGLSALAGIVAARPLLRPKPLEVLRNL